jgi:hypothetical protein
LVKENMRKKQCTVHTTKSGLFATQLSNVRKRARNL